ncbi:methionine--tRNA ligase [Candidatus Peregrinibacteria bacterium]|nr:methionine--tRNA ligase [Candidatus Peregrinibacteria bacterium]
MPSEKSFYVTTAIAYVNGDPHIGFAMECIQADAIARYKRLMGFDVHFLTGTDENGTKNYESAQKEGIPPQEFVDRQSKKFQGLKTLLNLSNDDFIRTTDQKRHWPACQKLWKKMVEKGDIYKKEYEGRYCTGCERFMTERDLVNGKCVLHKRAPEILKEENYFFKLSRYSKQIIKLLESNTVCIVPQFRKNEILNLTKEGLHDVSFSRPCNVLPWGVPVPGDDTQMMYVWCDALTNYISAIDYTGEGSLFKKFWPADVHVIGKDIVRFHAGIWIGMLLSAEIALPKAEFIHGFITHNGEKMSKSLGNVVDPQEVIADYGTDALRYYLLKEIPLGNDGDFTYELFKARHNADLANNLGNLVNRVHTLVSKGGFTDFTVGNEANPCRTKVEETWGKYEKTMDVYSLHEGIETVWALVDFANQEMERTKPWALKNQPEEQKKVLCSQLEMIRHISVLLSPFLPKTSQIIRGQIGLSPEMNRETQQKWGALTSWKKLGERAILFQRRE